jgi:molybdate transport system substrate-binding protein
MGSTASNVQQGEENMPKNRILAVATALTLLAGMCTEAGAAELKVLCAAALRPALQELAPAFEKSSGHKLSIEYQTAGKVAEKVAGEDTIDVAIVTKPAFDKLARAAKMVAGSETPLGQQLIGLAVKKGAPKPDISSLDAMKKTLLAAKSITYMDPASGAADGIQFAQGLEKLGIAAELKAKTKLLMPVHDLPGGPVTAAVQRGEAEIGIQPIGVLMEGQGVDVVGPLPAELQSPDYTFIAGTPWTAEQAMAANALLSFLKSPEAKAAYKKHGMETG